MIPRIAIMVSSIGTIMGQKMMQFKQFCSNYEWKSIK